MIEKKLTIKQREELLKKLMEDNIGIALIDYLQERINVLDKNSLLDLESLSTEDIATVVIGRRIAVKEMSGLILYLNNLKSTKKKGKIKSQYE